MNNIGSKASNLIRIRDEFKIPVPGFEVLDISRLVKNFGEFHDRVSKLYRANDLASAESLAESLKLDAESIAEIAETARSRGWSRVSIRTSAALEDSADASFAGQYLTLLDVEPTEAKLSEAISRCIASILTRRVLEYAKSQGFETFDFGGSIIVQEMFFGDKAGVLFSEDGNGNFVVAQSNSWNNQVVEGANASEYLIPRAALADGRFKVSEEQEIVFTDTSGNKQRLARAPKHILVVCAFARQIEAKLNTPIDIEWASIGNRVVLLQFRPLTVAQIDYTLEWDSTNISENYPGITLPLTYSTIRELYAGVYPSFLRLLGTPERRLRGDHHAFDNMLGYLNGRVYYRISNWYALLKFLPGKNNQQFFEAMLNPVAKRGTRNDKPSLNLTNLVALTRFLWLLTRSERLSRRFKKRFAERLEFFSSYQPQFVNAETLLASSKLVRDDLLSEWAVPILNDIKLMVFHGLLQKYFFGAADNSEYLNFLQGLSDRASIRPLEELSRLGADLKKTLETTGARSIEELKSAPEWQQVCTRAAEYIEEYSARTPGELKLETVRISDRPTDVLTLALKAHESNFKSLTSTPEELLWPTGLARWKRPLLRWVAAHTRRAIDWRERFRFNRAQTFDLSRRMFDALGEVFAAEHVLESARDIYWLTQQEIDEIVNGHAWSLDARDVVARRKAEFETYSSMEMPLAVKGAGRLAARSLVRVGADSGDGLVGKGVAPGELTAEVVVATEFDPNLDVRGKILVVHHIDPGWTLLFTQAAGIIAERGNALSHAAIIAREIGIPAIVGVDRCTSVLKTGDTVSINGVLGAIEIETA